MEIDENRGTRHKGAREVSVDELEEEEDEEMEEDDEDEEENGDEGEAEEEEEEDEEEEDEDEEGENENNTTSTTTTTTSTTPTTATAGRVDQSSSSISHQPFYQPSLRQQQYYESNNKNMDQQHSSVVRGKYYKQTYRTAWEQMSDFQGWLRGVMGQPTRAFCVYCDKTLHAHRLSLLKHMCTLRHQKAAQLHNIKQNHADSIHPVLLVEKFPTDNPHRRHTMTDGDGGDDDETTVEYTQIISELNHDVMNDKTVESIVGEVVEEEEEEEEEEVEEYVEEIREIVNEGNNIGDNNGVGGVERQERITGVTRNEEKAVNDGENGRGAGNVSVVNRIRLQAVKFQKPSSSVAEVDESRGPITTQVTDTTKGTPVVGLQVSLYKLIDGRWTYINEGVTNSHGEFAQFTKRSAFSEGRYKMHFDVDKYFEVRKQESLYPFVEIIIDCKNPKESYHIPLLLSPFGYSTHKG